MTKVAAALAGLVLAAAGLASVQLVSGEQAGASSLTSVPPSARVISTRRGASSPTSASRRRRWARGRIWTIRSSSSKISRTS